jgi:myo-inositol-1(or 4)-monophosphatase
MIDAATIAFAHRLADTAGEVIRPYFRRRIDIDDKGGPKGEVFDPVTEADKGAERAIRAVIDRERPEDAILGEEYGEKAGTSGRRWVLDPVDGTRAFINGRHEWGSLISLEEGGRAVLGIIDQPVLGERFIGVNGKTSFMVRGIEGNCTCVRARGSRTPCSAALIPMLISTVTSARDSAACRLP